MWNRTPDGLFTAPRVSMDGFLEIIHIHPIADYLSIPYAYEITVDQTKWIISPTTFESISYAKGQRPV